MGKAEAKGEGISRFWGLTRQGYSTIVNSSKTIRQN